MALLSIAGATLVNALYLLTCSAESPPPNNTCESALEIGYEDMDLMVTTAGASDDFWWFEVDYWVFSGPDVFFEATLLPGETLTFLGTHPDGPEYRIRSEVALVAGCTPSDPWVGFAASNGYYLFAGYTNNTVETQQVHVVLNDPSEAGECVHVLASIGRSVEANTRSWGGLKSRF